MMTHMLKLKEKIINETPLLIKYTLLQRDHGWDALYNNKLQSLWEG